MSLPVAHLNDPAPASVVPFPGYTRLVGSLHGKHLLVTYERCPDNPKMAIRKETRR